MTIKILFTQEDIFEQTLCLLFPKHQSFICLNAGDCKILRYKKISKHNYLNWLSDIQWPNENALEYLSYKISEDNYNVFIDEYTSTSTFDKSFLYANFIKYNEAKNNVSFDIILKKLLSVNNTPTLITYSSNIKISDEQLIAINLWSKQNYMILNSKTGAVINVITNYDIKVTNINSVGVNASDRQRISRKNIRWQNSFTKLSDQEKSYIIMNLVNNYTNEK